MSAVEVRRHRRQRFVIHRVADALVHRRDQRLARRGLEGRGPCEGLCEGALAAQRDDAFRAVRLEPDGGRIRQCRVRVEHLDLDRRVARGPGLSHDERRGFRVLHPRAPGSRIAHLEGCVGRPEGHAQLPVAHHDFRGDIRAAELVQGPASHERDVVDPHPCGPVADHARLNGGGLRGNREARAHHASPAVRVLRDAAVRPVQRRLVRIARDDAQRGAALALDAKVG